MYTKGARCPPARPTSSLPRKGFDLPGNGYYAFIAGTACSFHLPNYPPVGLAE